MNDYINNFGPRVAFGTLYDWLDAFFNEAGGGMVYVQRVVGTSPALDSHTFNDSGAAASITVNSIGAAASGLSVQVQAGVSVGSYQLVVTGLPSGQPLNSGDLFTVADAVNWGAAQLLLRVVAAGVNPPANIAATALTGGADSRGTITDAIKVTAMGLIPKGLGMGQIVCPTSTTEIILAGLANHALNNNRFALASGADTSSVGTLTSAAAVAQADATIANGGLECVMLCTDWQLIPGLTPGATRTVDPTAIVAALIATSDAATGNPNLAAAGANGIVGYAVGKTQVDWTDAQTTTLVAAGVNPFRMVFGGERFYSFRTLANPYTDQVFVMATASRLRMFIENQGYIIGQSVLGAQIDGQGREQTIYGSLISGFLLGLYSLGALYGNTAAQAYVVDVGADVNTPQTIANRELHAAVGIRPSPFAETVYFALAAYPVTQPV